MAIKRSVAIPFAANRWRKAARSRAPPLNSTINREMAALKRMFRLGLRLGAVATLPHIQMLQEDNVRSGFFEPGEFKQFLNVARRSLFEDVSMLLVFEKLGFLDGTSVDELLARCDELSRKITNFSRSL